MPLKLVYMLQQVEYDPIKYYKWIDEYPDLTKINKRGKLVVTTKTKALLFVAYGTYLSVFCLMFIAVKDGLPLTALGMFIVHPIIVSLMLFNTVVVGWLALNRKRTPLMKKAKKIFTNHPGKRIAILGSYGKTSMKEILATVLSEKFQVAMTPGNENVPISHARWSQKLTGDEDVLIIEYGEGEPGDIRKLANLSSPNMAVMTGVAPNHLDHYKTLDALESDLADIESYVSGERLYVNAESKGVIERLKHRACLYSNREVNGWSVSDVKVDINGTSFKLKRGSVIMKLHSKLIGEHNIGPLSATAAIAYDLGLSDKEIELGVSKTKPFEHRMQARQLHGAWLIDDTYNGNLEGFKAGLKLLAKLEAKRKIYVTPGLVDQGEETERVHLEVGQAIANAHPDKVVLMKNSNTEFIKSGMKAGGYTGEVVEESDPLGFYTNIEQFLAAGDLVLMQNDLPDAYS